VWKGAREQTPTDTTEYMQLGFTIDETSACIESRSIAYTYLHCSTTQCPTQHKHSP
jgi:hypothetical protein